MVAQPTLQLRLVPFIVSCAARSVSRRVHAVVDSGIAHTRLAEPVACPYGVCESKGEHQARSKGKLHPEQQSKVLYEI